MYDFGIKNGFCAGFERVSIELCQPPLPLAAPSYPESGKCLIEHDRVHDAQNDRNYSDHNAGQPDPKPRMPRLPSANHSKPGQWQRDQPEYQWHEVVEDRCQ